MISLHSLQYKDCDAMVQVPVAQLRREPTPYSGGPQAKDRSQESQVLFGERLQIIDEQGDWVKVQAIEQPYLKDGQWIGYPGWVERQAITEPWGHGSPMIITQNWVPVDGFSDLCLGSVVWGDPSGQISLPNGHSGRIDPQFLRELPAAPSLKVDSLLAPVPGLLGAPYFWGGRCPHKKDLNTSSFDCSGLVQMLFRLQGWVLPRNSGDQREFCAPVEQVELEAGNLFFMKAAERDAIDHVGLVLPGQQLLEATEITHTVRTIPLAERLSPAMSFAQLLPVPDAL